MTIKEHNGIITLTSFADLASVLDPTTLPPGPDSGAADEIPEAVQQPTTPDNQTGNILQPLDLAELAAQVSRISSGLDAIARQDAFARDRAEVDLALYDALVSDKQQAEAALGQVRRVKDEAEQLAAQAFTQSAATEASQQAVTARAAELAYIEFLSDRAARLEVLAARPDLARVLCNRSRLAEQRAEVAGRAEAERRAHLVNGLAELDEALVTDHLEEAQRIVQGLLPQFPDDSDLRQKGDRVRWLLRHRLVAPAEQALSEVTRRRYRDDPELTVARLVELDTSKLPEELGRRVFGVWSNACYSLVQQREWHTPRRYAPFISRGMIFACPTPDSPATTVSSLGLPEWCPGKLVEDAFVIKTSRPLEPPQNKRSHQ